MPFAEAGSRATSRRGEGAYRLNREGKGRSECDVELHLFRLDQRPARKRESSLLEAPALRQTHKVIFIATEDAIQVSRFPSYCKLDCRPSGRRPSALNFYHATVRYKL